MPRELYCRHGNGGSLEGQNQIKIAWIKFHKAALDQGQNDRISALPDCLLIDIISRLPSTKYAIRTGTISKRWKHLWTSVDTLIFTHSHDSLTQRRLKPMSDFISIVDKTLAQCRQLKLKKFKVYTSYDMGFESQVNNWIRYAISCNVEKLDIASWYNAKAKIILDQKIFSCSCFTDMILAGCVFKPNGAISWKNLRKLCIFEGKLDEDLIANILSGSPLLETLVLDHCYGYKRLDITSKSIKNLVFSGYIDPDDDLVDIVEINVANIQSLKIQGGLWLWKLLLLNVSSEVKVNLDYYQLGYRETAYEKMEEAMLKGFILNLRHVKELKIGLLCYKVLCRLDAKGFVFPSNIMLV